MVCSWSEPFRTSKPDGRDVVKERLARGDQRRALISLQLGIAFPSVSLP
jgi:hypothetical protein